MKQKYIKGILGVTFVALIGFGATILGIIPQSSVPKIFRPYTSVLISVDEDYVDEPCTQELCGDNDLIEDPTPDPVVPDEPSCIEDTFNCGSWSECTPQGIQTRTCSISNDCKEVVTPSPATQQECVYHAPVLEQKKPVVVKPAAPKAVEPVRPVAPEIPVEKTPLVEATPKEVVAVIQEQVAKTNAIQDAKVEVAHLKEVEKVVAETPVFAKILGKDGVQELTNEIKEKQSIVPPYIPALSPKELDAQKKADSKALEAVAAELANKGAAKEQIEEAVQVAAKKINAERTREQVRAYSEKALGVKINNNKQDSDASGISDDVKVLFGAKDGKSVEKLLFGVADEMPTPQIKPGADNMPTPQIEPGADNMPIPQIKPGADNMPIPQIKPGADNMPTPQIEPTPDANMPIALGLRNGSKLNNGGFVALISGPRGAKINLVAINQAGREIVLGSAVISENNRAVVHVNQPMENGFYGVRAVRNERRFSSTISHVGAASVLNAAESNHVQASKLKVVELVGDESIEQPTIKNIQDLDIAGLRDIKVSVGHDGKVTVKGSADINAAVIGTFQSAVFTSAILADVDTGLFEVTSPEKLEAGTHEVTVYSTNPQTGTQSKPVRVAFTIIGAPDDTTKNARTLENDSTESHKLIMVSGGIGIALLITLALIMHKKNEIEE
jgi:hypothetical protein